MIRGVIPFKCCDCGNVFMALDNENCATVLSAPQKCTKCASMHTKPTSLIGFITKKLCQKVWKTTDHRQGT